MIQTRPDIISASRRTDIPAWYTPWFLERIRQQTFAVTNPFNRRVRQIHVCPENTRTLVFWSKNFGPFLALDAHLILADMGFNLFFNFTVNSVSPLLEPGLPALEVRLDQAGYLADRFGPGAVAWRFDPICFYTRGPLPVEDNLADFPRISRAMADFGITSCVTSFYDPYRKVAARTHYLARCGAPLIRFTDPGTGRKTALIRSLAAQLADKNMDLCLCCEADLFRHLDPVPDNVRENACINGPLLRQLYGGTLDIRRDPGQRTKQGCRCTAAVDIGSYQDHVCHHDCLFCYATTDTDIRIRQDRQQ
jgi:hypothetical protein